MTTEDREVETEAPREAATPRGAIDEPDARTLAETAEPVKPSDAVIGATVRSMVVGEAAKALAHLGLPVFPLGKRSKKPDGKRAPDGFKNATTEQSTISEWFANSYLNVGIAPPIGIFVLDEDPRNGGDKTLAKLIAEHGALPETITAITGRGDGGRHLYFTCSANLAITNEKPAPGLDIKGHGKGYLVAPPSVHPDSGQRYQWQEGHAPGEIAMAPAPAWLLALITKPKARVNGQDAGEDAKWITKLWREGSPKGRQRGDLASLVGYYIKLGMPDDAIIEQAWGLVKARFENFDRSQPWTREDIAAMVTSLHEADAEAKERADQQGDTEHLTDLGNAKRLAQRSGAELRYVKAWKTWMVWNGKRWEADATDKVTRLAHDTLRAMAAKALGVSDRRQRDELLRHMMASEGHHRIQAMVAEARALLPARPEDFDRDPWLLNVENGTINLRTRTGELGKHDPADMITKLAPVEYDPEARCETWEKFLDEAMGSDAEMQAFLQHSVGYSLTGDTGEEKLFFIYGPAAAGKSTFTEAIKAMLGDYATTANFETFLKQQHSGGPREDIARLKGARFVVSLEVDEGKQLAEGIVKSVTGGDTVAARHLFRETFEYRPQFKLWLAANHKPHVHGDDDAMWRRILVVPFERVVPEDRRDPAMKATLRDPKAAGPAILAWAVKGCLAWQRGGLGVPLAVSKATKVYQGEMDTLGNFLRDCCVLAPEQEVTASDFYTAYQGYCRQVGERSPSPKAVGMALRRRSGLTKRVSHGAVVWSGIGLRPDAKGLGQGFYDEPAAQPSTAAAAG